MKKRLGGALEVPVSLGKVPDGPRAAAAWPPGASVTVAAAAILALRLFPLSRPGHLSGFTQYDDGVYFGNALRLVHGALAYRDFTAAGSRRNRVPRFRNGPAARIHAADESGRAGRRDRRVRGDRYGVGADRGRRFTAASPGCPDIVDSVGTLIATTSGQDLAGGPAVLTADTSAWRRALGSARYVRLIGNGGNTGARIAWTPSLAGYFRRHFRLAAFASAFRGRGDVPRGGLYVRTLSHGTIPGLNALPGQEMSLPRGGMPPGGTAEIDGGSSEHAGPGAY